MSITRKRDKTDPDAIYVCIEAFAGEQYAVKEGMRLRGDHEAVESSAGLVRERRRLPQGDRRRAFPPGSIE